MPKPSVYVNTCRKALDKNQHPFMIKNIQQQGIRKTNIILNE